MNKPLLGLILGGVLGAIDGSSPLLSAGCAPEAREPIMSIVLGSTIKGLAGGVVTGLFARRYRSLPIGVLFGLGVGLVLAAIVAVMQRGYYLEIILPGCVMGGIVGFATQRYGAPAGRSAQRS